MDGVTTPTTYTDFSQDISCLLPDFQPLESFDVQPATASGQVIPYGRKISWRSDVLPICHD